MMCHLVVSLIDYLFPKTTGLGLFCLASWSSFLCMLIGALSIGIASSRFSLASLSQFSSLPPASFYSLYFWSSLGSNLFAWYFPLSKGHMPVAEKPLCMFDSVILSFHIEQSRFRNSPLLNVNLEPNVVILSPNTVSHFHFSGPNHILSKGWRRSVEWGGIFRMVMFSLSARVITGMVMWVMWPSKIKRRGRSLSVSANILNHFAKATESMQLFSEWP